MALSGHRFTQTSHLVHDVSSAISGFPFVPSSRTATGQTPMHMSPEQGEHLS